MHQDENLYLRRGNPDQSEGPLVKVVVHSQLHSRLQKALAFAVGQGFSLSVWTELRRTLLFPWCSE